jgi:ATP-binding cassette subfamily B multidrug efflux pump
MSSARVPGRSPLGSSRAQQIARSTEAALRVEKATDTRATVLRLGGYLRPYSPQILLLVLLILVSGVMSVLGPYLLGQAVDSVADARRLLQFTLLMFSAYGIDWLSQMLEGITMATVMQKVLRKLRGDLFQNLQLLSLRFFDGQPHGELMSRLTNDTNAINQGLSQSLVQLISSVLGLVGLLVAMLALNRRLTLGTLTIIPAMLLLTWFVGSRTRQGFRQLQAQMGKLNSLLEERLTGQRVVQAFAQEDAVTEAFQRENVALRDIGIKATVLVMLMAPMMTVLKNLDVAVVVGLGAWLVLRGQASVGTIVAFVNYASMFARPLRQLANLYNSVQSALAGAERVFEIIDLYPELGDAPDAVDLTDISGYVEFQHVNFCYVPDVPVLRDVSLTAKPGQTIALVGPTGAGKTTIVNLLARFYDLEDGAICVDGHDIRNVNKESLRQQLGIVLQDTFLFADTVMENIRYGRLDASDEECVTAAKLANADQFIRRLPEGYQTQLSERASNLSQGQRQLLAIARAVLSDPGILILDEATSSVDSRTELHIQQALLRLMEGRTSFVIAHRLSTIRRADGVLVINDGQIIERGTHEELLARRGVYYNAHISQFKGLVARTEASSAREGTTQESP